jgi:hypothetical protein
MTVKLNKNQFTYLNDTLLKGREDILKTFEMVTPNSNVSFVIDDDIADKIRDMAGERLQSVGFNINYELTDEGKMLEDLVDLFYG